MNAVYRFESPLRLAQDFSAPAYRGLDARSAAVIITNNIQRNRSVRLSASVVTNDTPGLGMRKNLLGLKASRDAANQAYLQAGIEPSQIQVAEADNCYSIAQILAVQDLSLCPSTLINTSGGLKPVEMQWGQPDFIKYSK